MIDLKRAHIRKPGCEFKVYEVYANHFGPEDSYIHGAFRDPKFGELWGSCCWTHDGRCYIAFCGTFHDTYKDYDLIVDPPRTFRVNLYRTPSGIVEPIIPSHTAVPDNWTLISATTMTEGEGL
jgi:hypothetical protein